MDQSIRPRKFTATFVRAGGMEIEYDVTKEIVAAGGTVPKADENGTDLLKYAEAAPVSVHHYTGTHRIYVREV